MTFLEESFLAVTGNSLCMWPTCKLATSHACVTNEDLQKMTARVIFQLHFQFQSLGRLQTSLGPKNIEVKIGIFAGEIFFYPRGVNLFRRLI